jgi:hypothetical protein
MATTIIDQSQVRPAIQLTPGVCCMCGCTAANACHISTPQGDIIPCAWTDDRHVLCDNPGCLIRAAAIDPSLLLSARDVPAIDGAANAKCLVTRDTTDARFWGLKPDTLFHVYRDARRGNELISFSDVLVFLAGCGLHPDRDAALISGILNGIPFEADGAMMAFHVIQPRLAQGGEQ